MPLSLSQTLMLIPHLLTIGRTHHARQTQCSSTFAVDQTGCTRPGLALRSAAKDGNVMPYETDEVICDVENDCDQPRRDID